MRKIDYFYKNFDIHSFCKNLKKETKNNQCEEGGDFLTCIVLDSVRNISQIKKEINLYQFTKNNSKNVFSKFVKKFKNNYSDEDVEKYFFEKNNVLNTESHEYSDFKSLLQHHVNTGEFFRRFKKFFEITFYGQLTYLGEDGDNMDSPYEDIFCLHVPLNKKFYLFFYGYERNLNDSSGIIRIFNKQPKTDEIFKIIKSSKVFRYADISEQYKWRRIVRKYTHINFDKQYNRIFSEGYKLEHKIEPHFLNEEDYFKYHNTKGESHIAYDMAISNPEKYFKEHFKSLKQISFSLKQTSSSYGKGPKIKGKIKDNKFFKFVMSNRFNYRNNIKFIADIIYSYDDVDGFLEYVPKKIQEGKSLKEEIRILKLFRGNDKKFIIKVFHTNKDKLEDLAKNYMPSTIFDDAYLMNELIKLDINFTADIGKKLQRNKKFMSKVNKLLPKK